ncbi:hypothetical protein Tco_0638543 [Tanacetum coccineum]
MSHGVEFQLEPQEDRRFEVEPLGSYDMGDVVATVTEEYAHESLTFRDAVACVDSEWQYSKGVMIHVFQWDVASDIVGGNSKLSLESGRDVKQKENSNSVNIGSDNADHIEVDLRKNVASSSSLGNDCTDNGNKKDLRSIDAKIQEMERQFLKDTFGAPKSSTNVAIDGTSDTLNASASNLRRIQVKDTVKKVKDYLKTYSSAGMDLSGSDVTNVPQFDVEDFSSWKDMFLVYLDGLEPYLLEILENGPFIPKYPASTPENVLIKPQKQWSSEDKKLVNQDKRLKSSIISCLPNKIMKSVIQCTTAKSMWNGLILGHQEPSEIRDTKIAALRLNSMLLKLWKRANNSIKNDSLAILFGKYDHEEGLIDQIYEYETNRFTIQGSSSKVLISNTYFQESDSDVKEDNMSSKEFLADLNQEVHDRALFANQKRFYKRSGRVASARKPMDYGN